MTGFVEDSSVGLDGNMVEGKKTVIQLKKPPKEVEDVLQGLPPKDVKKHG